MPTSAYIHIPFCKSKCKYCSFVSFEDRTNQRGYIYSLLKEIDYYYKGEVLDTLYIGGGTPSLLLERELELIISKFNFNHNSEVTIEINPNDLTEDYAKILKNLGFNRISIGSQSFNDEILAIIGRRHTSNEIKNVVKILKNNGFNNINLDLIYGLPSQTIEDFKYDLEQVVKLDIQHVSLYGLKIDEGCYFYNNMPQNLPDSDMQADMYLLAKDILEETGFVHYEISNYSKQGFESKHNSNYWKSKEYYGFGVAAHGYVEGIRYSNYENLNKYMNNPTSHEFGKFLTQKEILEENIFLGLRLAEGININEINEKFNISFDEKYAKIIKKYLDVGYLIKTNSGYKLCDDKNKNGFLLSNIILSDFI